MELMFLIIWILMWYFKLRNVFCGLTERYILILSDPSNISLELSVMELRFINSNLKNQHCSERSLEIELFVQKTMDNHYLSCTYHCDNKRMCTLSNLTAHFFPACEEREQFPQGSYFSHKENRQKLISNVLINFFTFKGKKIDKKCLATKVLHNETLAHEAICYSHNPHSFPPTFGFSTPFYGCSFVFLFFFSMDVFNIPTLLS